MGYIMLQCHWGQWWQVKAIPHFTRCNHELYLPLHHSCVAHPPSIHVIMLPTLPAAASVQLHPLYLRWSCSADLCGVGRLNIQSQSTELWTVDSPPDVSTTLLMANCCRMLRSAWNLTRDTYCELVRDTRQRQRHPTPRQSSWQQAWHLVTSSATTWCLVTWRHTTVVTWSRVWARRGSTPHIKLPKCPLSLLWVDVDEGCK